MSCNLFVSITVALVGHELLYFYGNNLDINCCIRSKVRPPFHCLQSLKTASENHFCCQQARCRIDSLQAITVLGEPPWWAVVSSWRSSLGQRHASQTKADFGQENRCPSDCWIVLPFCSQLCIFFSFVTIPLEKWLHAKQPCTCPCNCYLSVFWTMQVCSSDYSYEYFISYERCLICVFQKQEKKSTVVYMLSITRVIPFAR